ncbi:MAG TPA: hypothetical protein PKE51_08885 [Gemmatimonadaceae bacterium]|nr:hypothetical protein [Gemmatimonadaceae bacterium]
MMSSFLRSRRVWYVPAAVLAFSILPSRLALRAQAAPPPMVVFDSFLNTRFFLTGASPRIKEGGVLLAFAPPDPVQAVVRIRRGETVVRELPARITRRVGTMAELAYRATNADLGSEEGERTLELVVNGTVAGAMTFTVRRRSTGDAFDPSATWELDGPWRTHAYIAHNPDGTGADAGMRMRVWVSVHDMPDGKPAPITLRGRVGGRTLFTTIRTQVSAPDFQFYDIPLSPDGSNATLNAARMAGVNGTLTIDMLQGQTVLRTFSVPVTNGSFAEHPLSTLDTKEPLRFLSPRVMSTGGVISQWRRYWMTR